MKIVGPAFYPDDSFCKVTKESCKKLGMELELYGIGKPFIPHGADAQVFQLREFLKTLSDDIVLVTDTIDVVFFAPSGEIMENYGNFGTNLVMSTERNCWPPVDEIIQGMPMTKYGYNYINAGQYIGNRNYIIHCLEHLLENYRWKYGGLDNSQGWWPLALLRKELDFVLDSECRIFQTMCRGEVLVPKEGRPFNPETGRFPCSVHFNGGGCKEEAPFALYRRYYGNI